MENYIQFMTWLASIVGVAVLSAQIAYESTIVQEIKGYLLLDEIELKLKFKWWFKPLVWLHFKLKELLNCPFCISFWIMLWTNYNVSGFNMVQSIILAPVAMAVVHLYQKLTF